MEVLKSNFFAMMEEKFITYSVPAAPASTAEVTKAMILYLGMEMPMDSAAMRLSRMAMMARPWRLRIRLSTTTRVIITRMKPMVRVEIFWMPTTPMGPRTIIWPSAARSSADSLMPKWTPLESLPT